MNLTNKQEYLLNYYSYCSFKHMFEKDKALTVPTPEGSTIVGISIPFGRWTALDHSLQKRYSFRGEEWVEATDFINPAITYDYYTDLKAVYKYLKLSGKLE